METVFDKFGGIRPMASKIGLPVSTVKSWHTNGKIPEWRHAAILDAAKKEGFGVTEADLINLTAAPRQPKAAAQAEAA